MKPVYQTRYAAETLGNCLEACIASILELPLAAVPDRAAHVDLDRWADLVGQTRGRSENVGELEIPDGYEQGEQELAEWLTGRGVITMTLPVADEDEFLRDAGRYLDGEHWIGITRRPAGWLHATVWEGDELVHNPDRRGFDIGVLVEAQILSHPFSAIPLGQLAELVGMTVRAARQAA